MCLLVVGIFNVACCNVSVCYCTCVVICIHNTFCLTRFANPFIQCVVSFSLTVCGILLTSPGAIPASMIPTPIPAHLFDSDSDSDSSHLGYDSDSDSDTICMNDSDSYSIPTACSTAYYSESV